MVGVGGAALCAGSMAGTKPRKNRRARGLRTIIYATGWAQCAQRLAASGISLRHSGQVFMEDGASGSGFFSRAISEFNGSTMAKYTTLATMTNEMAALRKLPI